jgi:hypothetical protein
MNDDSLLIRRLPRSSPNPPDNDFGMNTDDGVIKGLVGYEL